MNKSLIALILLTISTTGAFFVFSSTNSDHDLFTQWYEKLGESFTGEELIFRTKVFQENLKKINQHNAKLGKNHELGFNLFAFLTADEFRAKYLTTFASPISNIVVQEATVNGPTVDWVSYGAVRPVRNQGSCSASYAFSAVGAIEGISAITYKTQTQYSVQQIVDCSGAYGNYGCSTGRMDSVFNYVRDRGINSEAAYPYKAHQQSCSSNTGLFKIRGHSNITDCSTLANALTGRPISVAVDGNNFQFYKSGIFNNCQSNLSLATLLVGMNDSYWSLKLSWGDTWGEKGYIRLSRGDTCGLCRIASYPY